MKRRGFFAILFGGFCVAAFGQKSGRKKFYITGLANTATANDCTIPPLVTYGTDRVNALLHCCEDGGLTVWTEGEYLAMRRKVGAEFDKACKAAESKGKS